MDAAGDLEVLQLETRVFIPDPLQAVFDFATDGKNMSKWQMGLARLAPRTGTVTCEAPRRLEIRGKSEAYEFATTYHFEAVRAGTEIICTCHVKVREDLRSVEVLIGQMIALETDIRFAILKSLLEDKLIAIDIGQV